MIFNHYTPLTHVGFTYLGTNENGTETFKAPNGDIVKSYLSGYVRKSVPTRNYYTHKLSNIVYQMNLVKNDGRTVERIMLPTHNDRYKRLLDWNYNCNH